MSSHLITVDPDPVEITRKSALLRKTVSFVPVKIKNGCLITGKIDQNPTKTICWKNDGF